MHVPEIDFPSYNTNANLVPPIQSGSIDWAGNYVSDIQGNYLSKSPQNHTWTVQRAVLQRQQRGVAVVQHHQGTAERPGGAAGDQLRHRPAAALQPRARPATSRRPRPPAA